MNTLIRICTSTCLVGCMLASAPTHAGSDAPRPRIVIDCAQPALPTQREVGELLDQHNFAQVYASRASLMAEARRICRRDSAQTRRVAFEPPTAPPIQPAPPHQERRIAGDRRGH